MSKPSSGGELFVVDNSDSEWKVLKYLREWAEISNSFDIASAYFEIGSLLALDGQWQKLGKIRILMGNEVSLRTKKAIADSVSKLKQKLDGSIESTKEANDFLLGVPAIVEALRTGKIECRVYTKEKFHAKAYITHAKQAVIGSAALVGSSNFTYPGLTSNIELNIQVRREVDILQEWYERYWSEAEDITPDILKVIERHTKDYAPFDVYSKALQEYFRGHEMTADEWELAGPATGSRMYPYLDRYQKDGYHALLKIARQYRGALLCDGVGLGKTFVGLMVIERLVVHERKRVLLLAPKAAREDVWNKDIKRYLPHIGSKDFSSLVVMNHTDLGRGGEYAERFEHIREMADAIVIDEAHHFRNPGVKGTGERKPSRYRLLYDIMQGSRDSKQLYMLTATPINNKLDDFRHMTELFARRDDYFASTLGINSIRGHFVAMERELKAQVGETDQVESDTNMVEAQNVLFEDSLFKHLVVQRSRVYVKESQMQHGDSVTCFPEREEPKVAEYSVKKTYGRLLGMIEAAFAKDKPLFCLAIYYPLGYYKGTDSTINPFEENRQKQVVRLIRIQFLKRFESSAVAFECSCNRLLLKFLAWVTVHCETDAEKRRLDRWRRMHGEVIGYVESRQLELFGDEEDAEEEDALAIQKQLKDMLADVEHLSREEYRVEEMLDETFLDLEELVSFVEELKKFDAKHDDKLKALIKLLKTDSVLKSHKVLIFSEFADTARYMKKQLIAADIKGVDEIDSGIDRDRTEVIRCFAPYYNGFSSGELADAGKKEIRVLISTDVLSEGLNLQDATRLINYDIHWNPVRLMQRIGRVDRRMNPETEAELIADHPEQKELRGKIAFWNFLPPSELDDLLNLYAKVAHKTLRISKTLGIEGKKLLTPADEFDALKEFNMQYDGTKTPVEKMHLDYQQLLKENPELEAKLATLPSRVFSGKQHPKEGTKAVFFCYVAPRPDMTTVAEDGEPEWTEKAGECKWYLYSIATKTIQEDPTELVDIIRSTPETPRHCEMEKPTLGEIRKVVEKHVKNTILKKHQAPVGVKPILKAWMELN